MARAAHPLLPSAPGDWKLDLTPASNGAQYDRVRPLDDAAPRCERRCRPLLKGLIYGPNGRPMSPSHTRRRGRIYRYYVTREAIADGYDTCTVTCVPAADVEGAVLDHIQKLLAAPELVARTWSTS